MPLEGEYRSDMAVHVCYLIEMALCDLKALCAAMNMCVCLLGVGFVYIQTIGFICIVWYLDKNFGGMFFGVERCWENGGC